MEELRLPNKPPEENVFVGGEYATGGATTGRGVKNEKKLGLGGVVSMSDGVWYSGATPRDGELATLPVPSSRY